jgi:hypothetical protein
MYPSQVLHNTPLARRIHRALDNKRAFAAYLRSLPDDTVFDPGSPDRGPVAEYLRTRRLGPVDVYTRFANWQEGYVYNECRVPRETEHFIEEFSNSDHTAKAAREIWARVTAAQPGPLRDSYTRRDIRRAALDAARAAVCRGCRDEAEPRTGRLIDWAICFNSTGPELAVTAVCPAGHVKTVFVRL